MIDWRWRRLFNIISVSYIGAPDRIVLWRTACILRAKMHTDKKYE